MIEVVDQVEVGAVALRDRDGIARQDESVGGRDEVIKIIDGDCDLGRCVVELAVVVRMHDINLGRVASEVFVDLGDIVLVNGVVLSEHEALDRSHRGGEHRRCNIIRLAAVGKHNARSDAPAKAVACDESDLVCRNFEGFRWGFAAVQCSAEGQVAAARHAGPNHDLGFVPAIINLE